jgi:hypothetical protein
MMTKVSHMYSHRCCALFAPNVSFRSILLSDYAMAVILKSNLLTARTIRQLNNK